MTLALAYAPAASRAVLTQLFTLDARLARATREASEPIIAQMKLAWWRDRLADDPANWPKGEPLLAKLAGWQADIAPLGALVDGWEALAVAETFGEEDIRAFAQGRAAAFGVAAEALGVTSYGEQARLHGFAFGLADAFGQVAEPEARDAISAIADRRMPAEALLPRSLRPLAVLGALADRALDRRRPILSTAGDFLTAVRVGVVGR